MRILVLAAVAALGLAGCGAREYAGADMPVLDRSHMTCDTDAECEALDGDTVLLATGCGPDKITTVGREEDELAGVAPGERCREIIRVRVVGNWS